MAGRKVNGDGIATLKSHGRRLEVFCCADLTAARRLRTATARGRPGADGNRLCGNRQPALGYPQNLWISLWMICRPANGRCDKIAVRLHWLNFSHVVSVLYVNDLQAAPYLSLVISSSRHGSHLARPSVCITSSWRHRGRPCPKVNLCDRSRTCVDLGGGRSGQEQRLQIVQESPSQLARLPVPTLTDQ